MRYNEVTFKGTHNSAVGGWRLSLTEQLDFHISRPGHAPVQSVELDICQLPGNGGFYVSHSRREAGQHVSIYLDQLRLWAAANPGHPVITVVLDTKWVVSYETLAQEIDTAIQRTDLNVLRPADLLKGRHENIRDAVTADGWPEVDDLVGKFIFMITGRGIDSYLYGGGIPPERLEAFSSFEWRSPGAVEAVNNDPWRLFTGAGAWNSETRKGLLRAQGRLLPHVITRVWGIRSDAAYQAAKELGVNILAVDDVAVG